MDARPPWGQYCFQKWLRVEDVRLHDEWLDTVLCFDTVRITSHVYTVTGCTA